MKLKYTPSKTIIAIAGIVLMELMALYRGIDGALLGTAIAVIGGLAGYTLREAKK